MRERLQRHKINLKPSLHRSDALPTKLGLYSPARHESFVVQWLEHSTGVRKVIVSIPVEDSEFSLSLARDMLIASPLISSPSLKFTIFLFINESNAQGVACGGDVEVSI